MVPKSTQRPVEDATVPADDPGRTLVYYLPAFPNLLGRLVRARSEDKAHWMNQ